MTQRNSHINAYIYMGHLIALIFALPFFLGAASFEAPEVEVKATSISQPVFYQPHTVTVKHSPSAQSVGETISKLPGVQVRNASGLASFSSVITPQAIGTPKVGVFIDDFSVINPTGQGINLSLLPQMIMDQSEFDQLSGGIHLNTVSLKKEPFWKGSLLLGSANTVQASGVSVYNNGFIGISGLNTSGNYSFRTSDGAHFTRANNDSWAGSVATKYVIPIGALGQVELLDVFTHSEHTVPGSLKFPTRDHEKDTLNLFGVRISTLLGKKDSFSAMTANTYTRTNVRDVTDTRGYGTFSKLAYTRNEENISLKILADHEHDYLKENTTFVRQVYGSSVFMQVDHKKFRFTPALREKISPQLGPTTDGSIGMSYFFDKPDTISTQSDHGSASESLSLGYAYSHFYPPLMALYGFSNSGFTLLPNANLKTQTDNLWTLSYNNNQKYFLIYSQAFANSVRNRATFSADPILPRGQYVNAADVFIWGTTLDGQLLYLYPVTLRGSVSLARAWDRTTAKDMPYKPHLQGLASVLYDFKMFSHKFTFSVEETYQGKRYADVENIAVLSPSAQTNIGLNIKGKFFGEGMFFVKVLNVLDVALEDSPGFPQPGRSFYLGYSI